MLSLEECVGKTIDSTSHSHRGFQPGDCSLQNATPRGLPARGPRCGIVPFGFGTSRAVPLFFMLLSLIRLTPATPFARPRDEMPFYGKGDIPEEWREIVAEHTLISEKRSG